MTKAELTILDSLFSQGHVTVVPNSPEHKAARKLCTFVHLVERETVCGGTVVYQYRISNHAARMVQINFPE